MPPTGRRRTQGERRDEMQQRLFRAVIECLDELGYEGMTMKEVAHRAGASQGIPWHYFKTKAEMTAATVRWAEASERSRVEPTARAAVDDAAVVSALLSEPSDQVGRALIAVLRGAAADVDLAGQLGESSWSNWIDVVQWLDGVLDVENLSRRDVAILRIATLARTAKWVFVTDPALAQVLQEDMKMLVGEVVAHNRQTLNR